MKAIAFASIVVASVTAAAEATVTLIPLSDNRLVHVQGSITPAVGEPLFDIDVVHANDFEPFDASVDLLLELPTASSSGDSAQTSEVRESQFVASGFSTGQVAANMPGTTSSVSSCSHYVLMFEVIEPTPYTLTGSLDAVDAAAGTVDGWAWVKIERLGDGFVVDETTNAGTLDIDSKGVLAAGIYRITVESHVVGTVEDEPSAAASSSFDVTLTVQERCPDLDGDNMVGITDFLILLAGWGPNDCFPDQTCPDLNGDGIVGIVDFLDLLAAWGPCP